MHGYLKSKVYFNKQENIKELRNRIRTEIQQIKPLTEVLREFVDQLAYCQAVNSKLSLQLKYLI